MARRMGGGSMGHLLMTRVSSGSLGPGVTEFVTGDSGILIFPRGFVPCSNPRGLRISGRHQPRMSAGHLSGAGSSKLAWCRHRSAASTSLDLVKRSARYLADRAALGGLAD